MKKLMGLLGVGALAATFSMGLGTSLAHASNDFESWSFHRSGKGGGPNANAIKNLGLTYTNDGGVESLTGSFEFAQNSTEGFWLVISDGPNPKFFQNEYAILYGDLENNRITAYNYNGENKADSWNDPGEFIASFTDAFSVSDVNAGLAEFTIDVTNINAYVPQDFRHLPANDPKRDRWDGVRFEHEIGIWFHFVDDLSASYRRNGRIKNFHFGREGWVDIKDRKTKRNPPPTDVPEPASMGILGVGLIGMGIAARRRRQAAA
ncbi:MAG: PEP-CTERM sorting domain-containing protein [Pseudomonadota bacterium]